MNKSGKSHVRWNVAILLFAGVTINFMDRVNLSVAAPVLMKEFHFAPLLMGIVMSAFVWSYVAFQIPSGLFLDRFGSKVTVGIAAVSWSLVSALTSTINTFGALIGIRLMLGATESPIIPSSAKAVGNWFPQSERGLASGIWNAGPAAASAFAAPLVTWLIIQFNWRVSFIVTGFLGLVWVVFWLLYFRNNPSSHPSVSEMEKEHISNGMISLSAKENQLKASEILKYRNVWGVFLGNFGFGYVFWTFATWLPGYLVAARHMELLRMGIFVMIPWLCALVAVLLGGWLSDYLVKKGYSNLNARKYVCALGLIIATAVIPAAFVNNVILAEALLSISISGAMFNVSSNWVLPTLILPNAVGTLGGLLNVASNGAGILAPIVLGWVVSATNSFTPAFITAGTVSLISACCYLFIIVDKDNISSSRR